MGFFLVPFDVIVVGWGFICASKECLGRWVGGQRKFYPAWFISLYFLLGGTHVKARIVLVELAGRLLIRRGWPVGGPVQIISSQVCVPEVSFAFFQGKVWRLGGPCNSVQPVLFSRISRDCLCELYSAMHILRELHLAAHVLSRQVSLCISCPQGCMSKPGSSTDILPDAF